MANWITKTSDAGKSTVNVIKSIGPFAISQSEAMSDAYVRHQLKLASVDAGKELLLQEVHTLGEIRKKLLNKYVDSSPEDRVSVRRDLAEIDGSLRQLRVGDKALNYLHAPSERSAAPAATGAEAEVSLHWMDRFRELAGAHNEPWREDLLARALATESSTPGTVSPRALWLLGTLEEIGFTALAAILDLCSFIAGLPIIPNHQPFNEKPIPNLELGKNLAIGHLVFHLEDLGLIGNTLTTSRTLRMGESYLAYYDSRRFKITCLTGNLSIPGVIFTGLGLSIASFYEPKVNPLGAEIFEAWIASLDKTRFLIEPETE